MLHAERRGGPVAAVIRCCLRSAIRYLSCPDLWRSDRQRYPFETILPPSPAWDPSLPPPSWLNYRSGCNCFLMPHQFLHSVSGTSLINETPHLTKVRARLALDDHHTLPYPNPFGLTVTSLCFNIRAASKGETRVDPMPIGCEHH